jgi:cGMP-dependent protein kinase
LSKGYVVKCGMQTSVKREKDLQLMCNSSFIVKLFETFNSDQSLLLLLELALGGELYATYNKKGLHGQVPHAKFYVGGTLFAFDHLHSKKIIFRDLKPENVLLTNEGRVKLTDLGLAKQTAGKTFTTCGTPDYFAPEMINSKGHTHAVDWWCLGILLFELMTGHPPFESPSPMQTYAKVRAGILKVKFPGKLKGACEELVKGLCSANATDRLPMKKQGSENVQKHVWYEGFDWRAMENLTLKPPYLPAVKSATDASNFKANPADKPPEIKFIPDSSNWDKDFATSD